jgi:hypothetical protein
MGKGGEHLGSSRLRKGADDPIQFHHSHIGIYLSVLKKSINLSELI